MYKNAFYYFILSLFCFSCFACKTNLLVLEDLVPSARQQDFEVSFTQSTLTDFELLLNLSHEFRNPYNKELPIPDHAMGILLNDSQTDLLTSHKSVKIPAKSSAVLEYQFKLNYGTLQSLMGKNNKITFHTSIELDLSAYSDMLPNYQISVTEDFDLESFKLKPMAEKLLQKKIGKYELELEHSTHVKISAPPTISVSSEPIEITLLGEGTDIISPNDIKNALIPFGDLLINGQLDGIKDPFLSALIESSVTFPAPTLTDWDRTIEVEMEPQVLNMLRPLDPSIDLKWNRTKSILYQSVELLVADYFIDNILNPHVDPNASEKWDTFQVGYNNLKTTIFPDEIPGLKTRGFEIAIPVSFKNNNNFPISLPLFRSSVFVTGGQPFSIFIKPKGVNEVSLNSVPTNIATVDGNETIILYVVFSFDMKAFNHGIYSLFMKNQFEPNLKGIMSYDFGYGPMYFGYDMKDMNINYK